MSWEQFPPLSPPLSINERLPLTSHEQGRCVCVPSVWYAALDQLVLSRALSAHRAHAHAPSLAHAVCVHPCVYRPHTQAPLSQTPGHRTARSDHMCPHRYAAAAAVCVVCKCLCPPQLATHRRFSMTSRPTVCRVTSPALRTHTHTDAPTDKTDRRTQRVAQNQNVTLAYGTRA